MIEDPEGGYGEVGILYYKRGFPASLKLSQQSGRSEDSLADSVRVKLEVTSEQIAFTANNTEIAIVSEVNAEKITVIEPGSAVIPAKNLLEMVKKLAGELHVKTDKGQMTICSDEITVSFPLFSSAEYPNFPELDEVTMLTVGSNEFSKMIKQTAFAAATDMSRPVLTGVHFTLKNGLLTAVATNSQRLALQSLLIDSNHHASFTVPGSSLHELMKLLQHEQHSIHIYWSNTHIAFRTESFTFYSNLLAGAYPDTSRLIPDDFRTNITMDARYLLRGLDRACLFSKEWRNHNVSLEVVDSKMKISSKGAEAGKLEEMQTIKELEGDVDIRITFDASFLMDALKTIEEKEVKIRIAGDTKPVVLESIGNRQSVHLISPVRTK